MKTRIIVLIDFSPDADNLLKFAEKWGAQLHADLLLVHQLVGGVPALADNVSRHQILDFEREQALKRLRELTVHMDLPSSSIRMLVSEKGIAELLQEQIHQGFDDLILLGLKGTGLLKQAFLGSTATKVIEEVNAISVAVPLKSTRPPDMLTVAVSYKYPLNEAALTKLLHILKQVIDKIEFITIVTATDSEAESVQYLADISERFQHQLPSSINVFRGANAFSEIKTYLQKHQSSMLVAQKGSRTLSDRFFRRFLINELIHDGSMPLVVLPL